jgi:Pup amidohydrolase
MANGSCVSLETGASADLTSSLFETATPECTSPRDVVAYALANEQLLERALAKRRSQPEWALIKSNSDAHGHTLGQHESYDMQIATGGWRIAWWLGLLGLLPGLLVYRLIALLWMALVYGLWGLEQWGVRLWLRYQPHRPRVTKPTKTIDHTESDRPQSGDALSSVRSSRSEQDFDTADDLMSDREIAKTAPAEAATVPQKGFVNEDSERIGVSPFYISARWMQVAAFGLRCLHQPIAFWFGVLIRCVALRPQRRILGGLFASRCVIDGAGYVDEERRFWVSHRASQVDRMIGFGSYGGTRPMFRCDAMLREMFAGSPWSLTRYFRLFRGRQRIELAIGDSGMCQQSQYLRFGMTALALDWAEYARPTNAPQLRSSLQAIREFAKDWMLVRTVPDRRGIGQSAKDIQRGYLRQIKQWLESRTDVPQEAWEIIEQWQTTLNQLVMKPSDSGDLPMLLVGRIDWLSKLWVLHQLEPDTAWQVKKKIDIRYHELSEHGYHRQLAEFLQLAPIVRDEEIERARRAPPVDSPACRRGNLIRELASGASELRVDWRSAQYELDGVKYQVRF